MSNKSKNQKADFGHLEVYDPRGNTAEYTLPLRPKLLDGDGQLIIPVLTMRVAGQSNPSYWNAITKALPKGQAQRSLTDQVERNRRQDRELLPKYVIIGWAGIYDSEGFVVLFTEESCAAFLKCLPDWIMDEIRNFAAIPANFLPDDEPTIGEVDAQAGN